MAMKNALLAFAAAGCFALSASGDGRSLDVSRSAPRYFETGDGRGWIPVGMNICFDRLYGQPGETREKCEERFLGRMRKFAANGGNFVRLWLGHPFFEVMPGRAGEYDERAAQSVLKAVRLAEELGIRLKLTLEVFRRTQPLAPGEDYPPVFVRTAYLPYAKDMNEFFASDECFRIYLDRARYLKEQGLGDSPSVACIELWNEINATASVGVYAPWSDRMVSALQELFPKQLVVQNLGSYSEPVSYLQYEQLGEVKGNGFLQVHRYLDPGAQLDVCRGPMDVLAAQAVRDLWHVGRPQPVVLAEVGAVQANHAGPSGLYEVDRNGTLLHDALFAAFFAGSAGCGQHWHWDHQYVDRWGLWWHFGRFAEAVKGLDPVAEGFRPFYTETDRLRIYVLHGSKTTIAWCRDKRSDWKSELECGHAAELVVHERFPGEDREMDCYLPWEDRHVRSATSELPPFKRSIVVRFHSKSTGLR